MLNKFKMHKNILSDQIYAVILPNFWKQFVTVKNSQNIRPREAIFFQYDLLPLKLT